MSNFTKYAAGWFLSALLLPGLGAAQSFDVIDLPTGFQSGQGVLQFEWSEANGFYVSGRDDNDTDFLLRHEGDSLVPVPNPAGYSNAYRGYEPGTYFEANGLHYARFQADDGSNHLMRIDSLTPTEIAMPVGYDGDGSGFFNESGQVGGTVYCIIGSNSSNYELATFDGTAITPIASPTGFTGSGEGFANDLFEFGGNIYVTYSNSSYQRRLFQLSGSTLSPIAMPTSHNAGIGITNVGFELGGTRYQRSQNNNGDSEFLAFDGTTLTVVAPPSGYTLDSHFGTIGGKAYFAMNNSDEVAVLAEFDGTNYTLKPPAVLGNSGSGTNEVVLEDNQLFINYEDENDNSLFQVFDGTNLIEVPTPAGFDYLVGYLGFDGTRHYVSYGNSNFAYTLFAWDGSTLTEIANPANYTNSEDGVDRATPMVLNGTVYFQYVYDEDPFIQGVKGNAFCDVAMPTNYKATYYDEGIDESLVYNGILYTLLLDDNDVAHLVRKTVCDEVSNLETANVSDLSAVLRWSTACASTLQKVRYKVAGTSPWTPVLLPPTTDSLVLTGLTPGTTYRWSVQPKCGPGQWGTISSQVVFTSLTAPCGEPTSLSAGPVQPEQTRVNWTNDPAAIKVHIRWAHTGAFGQFGPGIWNEAIADTSRINYWITGLDSDESYMWQIQSICSFGLANSGMWSDTMYFSTPSSKQAMDDLSNTAAQSSLAVFPNPSNGTINVVLPPTRKGVDLNLLDAAGRVVASQQKVTQESLTWQLNHLPAGLYVLRLQSELGTVNKKLIIK